MKRSSGSLHAPRRLATTEARTSLPGLVRDFAARKRASKSLLDNAVEIGPRRRGGALLVPEVDARAAVARQEELDRRIEELEEELEDVSIGLFLQERLEQSGGETVSAEEFLRDLGLEDKIGRLPG